ncbi:hypothetical protein D0856_26260 [Vibrio owensii]|nr:hypothetical protein D0856_26260 [Vibrio owensii]
MPSVQIQDAGETKNRVNNCLRKKTARYLELPIANAIARFLSELVFIYSLSNSLSKKDFSFVFNLAY